MEKMLSIDEAKKNVYNGISEWIYRDGTEGEFSFWENDAYFMSGFTNFSFCPSPGRLKNGDKYEFADW